MNMDLSKKEIEVNMMYLQNLPIVHQLLRKIDKLKRRNKELKTMVRLLTKQPLTKPVLERGEYIHTREQYSRKDGEENIKLIIDTSEEILDINSDETEVVNPHSECSVIEKPGLNAAAAGLEYEDEDIEIVEEEVDDDEEEEITISSDEQELDYGELAQSKGELEEYLKEKEEEQYETTERADGGESRVNETVSTKNTPMVEEADEGESPAEDEDEDEEVMEIIIKGKTYYTTDDQNGVIYDLDEDGEISVEVGYFKNGKHYFNKK